MTARKDRKRTPATIGLLMMALTAVLALPTSTATAGVPMTPVGLEADMAGNHVIEPGEFPGISPSWRNESGSSTVDLTGTASDITGPPGATYGFLETTADYGLVPPGATQSCWEAGPDCYVLSISNPATRPAFHWHVNITETLNAGASKDWTLHIGRTFGDVSPTSIYYPFIETLVHNMVTAGCSTTPPYFCPNVVVTREQMAIFLLRALEGPGYIPPMPGLQTFDDVPPSSPYYRWIGDLVGRGITAGCSTDPALYCPADPVTREQMAILLLRTLEGGDYEPPAAAGSSFVDVDPTDPYSDWIEDIYDRGITAGCFPNPRRYCPTAPSARREMAVFLTRTFGLKLYDV